MNLGTICKERLGSIPLWQWESIEQVRKLLSDEESKSTYDEEILYLAEQEIKHNGKAGFSSPLSEKEYDRAVRKAWKMLGTGTLPKLHCSGRGSVYFYASTFVLEQYRYGDIVKFEPNEKLYDCGACIGIVSVACALNGGNAVAFEPVPTTFVDLAQNAGMYCTIVPVCCGVGDNNEQRYICTKGSADSATLLKLGDTLIVVRRIDDLVEEYGVPTFIKMDLEGFEIEALKGAEQTIRQHKPKMAVCLYHKRSDMWEIPILLNTWVPEYRFYCKKSGTDFVLFATL